MIRNETKKIASINLYIYIYIFFKEHVLIRFKRRCVLSALELDEESSGPFPQLFTEVPPLYKNSTYSQIHKYFNADQKNY